MNSTKYADEKAELYAHFAAAVLGSMNHQPESGRTPYAAARYADTLAREMVSRAASFRSESFNSHYRVCEESRDDAQPIAGAAVGTGRRVG